MRAIRIEEYVGENGITISINKLLQFKNQKVEIIILPAEGKKKIKPKEKFFNAVGKVDIDENEISLLRESSKL